MATAMDYEPESQALSMQDDHVSFEAILSEVAVKREGLVEAMMIDQGETDAIDKAEFFVAITHENRLGGLFDRLAHAQHFDPRRLETSHEVDRGLVADFEAGQRVGFAKDVIRCYKLSAVGQQLSVDGLGDGMIIVVFIGESKKGAGIEKDLLMTESLTIQAIVMIFSKIMQTTFIQSNDTLRRLARAFTTLSRRLGERFQLFAALDQGQLYSPLIFQADFFQWFENTVLIHCVKGSCHDWSRWKRRIIRCEVYRPVPVLSNTTEPHRSAAQIRRINFRNPTVRASRLIR